MIQLSQSAVKSRQLELQPTVRSQPDSHGLVPGTRPRLDCTQLLKTLAVSATCDIRLGLAASALLDDHAPRLRQRPEELGAVARPGHDRRVAHREAADRVERDEEHQVEGRRSPAADRRRRSSGTIASSCSPRSPSASPASSSMRRAAALPKRGVHQYKVLAIDRKTGKTVWEHVAREEEPHEAGARRQRHVGLELGDHRRHARLCLFRVARPVRLRHERQARLAGRLRRQEDAQPVRRRIDAGPLRQHAGRRLGSSQSAVVRDRARQDHRQGTVARRSSGDGHLGHAARRRAQRPAAGHRQRDEPGAQLRSANRQARVGRPRARR